MKIVDHVCHCARCKASGENGRYLLSVICSNCGKRHIAKFRKGDRHNVMDDCPFCGVARLNYGTIEEAEQWLTEEKLTEK